MDPFQHPIKHHILQILQIFEPASFGTYMFSFCSWFAGDNDTAATPIQFQIGTKIMNTNQSREW